MQAAARLTRQVHPESGHGYLRVVQGQQGGRGGGGVLNCPCMPGPHNGLVVQHSMGEAGQVQADHQAHFTALLHFLNTCTRCHLFCVASSTHQVCHASYIDA